MNRFKFDMDSYKVSGIIYDVSPKTPICLEMFVSTVRDDSGTYIGVPYLWGAQIYSDMIYGRDISSLAEFLTEISKSGVNIVYTFEPVDLLSFLSHEFAVTDDSMKGHSGEIFKFGIIVNNRKLTFKSLSAISGANTIEELADIPPILERRALTPKSKLAYRDYANLWQILSNEEKYIISLCEIYGDVKYIPNVLSKMIKRDLEDSCFGKKPKPYYQKQLGFFDKGATSYNRMPLPIAGVEHFEFLERAFQGGYVGFNTSLMDKTLPNVKSFDFTSSYIACMLAYKYPVIRHGYIYHPTLEQALELFDRGYLGIMRVLINGIRSTSKCRPIKYGIYVDHNNTSKGFRPVVDTLGDRVVDKDSGLVSCDHVLLDITNIDFQCYSWFYDWDSVDIQYIDLYHPGYLPKEYTDVVLRLYRDKSLNKGNPNKFIESVTKKKVNITYGLMVTGFWSSGFKMVDNHFEKTHYDINEAIDSYNGFTGRFAKRVSAYQWGVFCTAYARYNLLMIIKGLGDSWIYSDTDSVYFTCNDTYEHVIEKYNRYITSLLLSSPSVSSVEDIRVKSEFVDKEYNLGHMIMDGDYSRFKFLKLKTYLCERRDGTYKVTIAGCSNFNKEFFKTVEPFEWFTTSSDNFVPSEYCDSYNEYVGFGEYHGVVTDYTGKRVYVDLKGGCYKLYNDFTLKASRYSKRLSLLEVLL